MRESALLRAVQGNPDSPQFCRGIEQVLEAFFKK
jgi:hypothetical protein